MAKTSVTIPDDLLREARKLSDNFSALVTEAIEDYMRKKKVEKALGSFGKWSDRGKDSVDLVNEMRSEEGRTHGKRSR
jgi:post-segregation antitoxin (ccd killing protein)